MLTRRIWAANGTEVEITGQANILFKLAGRDLPTNALISLDIEEVMLGMDWLKSHKCLWDFDFNKLYTLMGDQRSHCPEKEKTPLPANLRRTRDTSYLSFTKSDHPGTLCLLVRHFKESIHSSVHFLIQPTMAA